MFASLQHEVCRELLKVNPKPPQYSIYLWKVLQIIKLPIQHSQPILWAEIHNLRSLSVLKVSPKLPKKWKYVEILTPTAEEDELDVKKEEIDISMVSCLTRCFPTFCRIKPQTWHIPRNQKHLMKHVGYEVHQKRLDQKWKLITMNLRKIRQTQPVSCNNAVCSA